MKNRTIRGILCGFFLLTSLVSSAQLNLNGLTLTGSFAYFHPSQINVACTGAAFTATVGSGDQQLISGDSIKLCPGFSVKTTGSSTARFRAFVDNDLMDAVILEPSVTTSIPKYDKVEIGINLPQYGTRINDFFSDPIGYVKVATSNYNDAAQGGIILNPYDPEHISVTGVFYRPGSPNTDGIIRHAFYYEEFNDVGAEDWVKDNSNPYEWRLRYSPGETGVWNGFINVHVNGVLMPETYFFTFTVVESDNHGFVKVAPNQQYLQYEDGTEFFPVGDNSDFTTPDSDNDRDNCHTANCNHIKDHRINRRFRNDFVTYLDRLSDQANGGNGGNFTRLMCAPWGLQFDMDRLGNYQTRQIEMYELDHVFAAAEERRIGINLTTMLYVEVDDPETSIGVDTNYSENWAWNPYNGDNSRRTYDPNKAYKGIAGLTSYLDFFSNATAKKIYKNKLRYISARWGYSASFLVHELINEMDQTKSYWDVPSHNAVVEDWMNEMAGYIKNELGDRQLTTASYAGDGFRRNDPARLTTLWGKPNIDLISGHHYSPRLKGLRFGTDDLMDVINTFNKPAMYNENDIDPFSITSACGRESLHNTVWASVFSGSYGAGLAWDARRYLIDDWYNASGLDVQMEYEGIRSFVGDMDLINYRYRHYNTISKKVTSGFADSPYENLFILRQPNGSPYVSGDRAYGWVHNRSYNHFTDQNGCAYYDNSYPTFVPGDMVYQPYATMEQYLITHSTFEANFSDFYAFDEESYATFFPSTPSDPYPVYPLSAGTVSIFGLSPSSGYSIEFYHTVGSTAGTHQPLYDAAFTTDLTGIANIPVPPTGGAYPPDWAYVIKRDGSRPENASEPEIFSETSELSFNVAPNPSTGVFRITGDVVKDISELEVTDPYGRKIESNRTDENGAIILDLSRQTTGVYIIRAKVGDQILTQKVVKE